MSKRIQVRSRRIACFVALAGLVATAVLASAPSSASAACPVTPGVFTTSWGGGSGHYNNDANWTNGAPSGSCDASITAAGTYTVLMTGGSVAKSMTIGGAGSNPTLQISAEGPNTNLTVAAGGQLSIASGAAITLKCNVTPSSCGSPNIGAPTITNAGAITVEADVNADVNSTPFISGPLLNTGTMQFNHGAKFDNGAVTNQGTVNVADGTILRSGGSSCGDAGVSFKNDAGGTLNATGAGTFNVLNYEQGAGSISGTSPVEIPCGSLKYTGNGASKVRVYGGITLTGTMQNNQSLTISDESSNTNAFLGGPFINNGTITLTCSIPCGAGGGPDIAAQGNTFTNAGTLTVAADAGTGSVIDSGNGGTIVNTGTINFNQSGALAGVINNQGAINIADTKTASNHGSSCGDTGAKFTNGTGGSVNGTGSGALSTFNYEQGAGTTTGIAPVRIPCGTVKYLGNGASTVQARGGFTLSGTIQAGQTLEISGADNNASANVSGTLTNNGTVLFTCPLTGCAGGSGGGPSWNGAGNAVVNAGTMTVAASSGTGGGIGGGGGTLTNTGTINFDQSGGLGGVVTNQGPINIADGKTVISTTGHCGDSGPRVINDTGGQINSVGTGTLSAVNFEQGGGTTSGPTPVTMNCGALKYVGAGASKVLIPAGNSASLTGNLAGGQTVTIAGTLHASSFSSAGSIVLDQSGGNPNLNLGGTLTNTGSIATSGASANTSTVGGTIDQTGGSAQVAIPAGTKLSLANPLLLKAGKLTGAGTLTGSVDNSGGTVAPGASPGTLTVSGNYTQGAGGKLEIEIGGTGAGQFDSLAVSGNATLGGSLALQPTGGYPASSTIGDSVSFLTYGGTRNNQFGSTTAGTLACPKQLSTSYDDTGKKVNAVVSSTGVVCNSTKQPVVIPVPDPVPGKDPDTVLGKYPKKPVKTKKAKAKISFSFSSGVAAATFECKLDKGKYAPCSSPKSYRLKPGKHTISVRAVSAGAVDPTPAGFSVKVVKQKPKPSK